MARKCIVWWSSDPVTLERICSITPFQPNIFRVTPASPPHPLKSPKCHRLKCHQPQTTRPAHTDTRNGPFFVRWKKESHRIKRSKMFNYHIIYTISMTIVTIGYKIVERIFESSKGTLFWSHWKHSEPLPASGGNRIIKLVLVKTKTM